MGKTLINVSYCDNRLNTLFVDQLATLRTAIHLLLTLLLSSSSSNSSRKKEQDDDDDEEC